MNEKDFDEQMKIICVEQGIPFIPELWELTKMIVNSIEAEEHEERMKEILKNL